MPQRINRLSYRSRVQEVRLRALIPSQAELARRTGLCRTTICALEKNRIPLSVHYAMLIKKATGCSLDDLFEEIPGEGTELESNERKRT